MLQMNFTVLPHYPRYFHSLFFSVDEAEEEIEEDEEEEEDEVEEVHQEEPQ